MDNFEKIFCQFNTVCNLCVMEHIQDTNDLTGQGQENGSESSASRINYPVAPLKKALEFAKKVYDAFGDVTYAKNVDIAQAHGLKETSIKSMLSTVQQFGLFELKYGHGYRVTSLFHDILRPVDDADQDRAIYTALQKPELYAYLFKHYGNRVLPPKNGLINLFIKQNLLKEPPAKKAIEVFLIDAQEHGLINRHGVLTMKATAVRDAEPNAVEKQDQQTTVANSAVSQIETEIPRTPTTVAVDEIRIPVPVKNGMGYVILPKDYEDDDLDMVARIARAYMKNPKKSE